MVSKLSAKLAGTILIILPSLLIVFHLCIFMRILPHNIVWTGRITSESTVSIMAIISILINLVVIFCAAVQMNYLKDNRAILIAEKILPFVFWYLVGNTIANLFSKTPFELYFFTPILIILTICFYRIWKS